MLAFQKKYGQMQIQFQVQTFLNWKFLSLEVIPHCEYV